MRLEAIMRDFPRAVDLGARNGAFAEALAESDAAPRVGLLVEADLSGAMLAGQFPLGFKLELHRKDLAIALAAAAEVGLELPLSERVAALEEALIAQGHGGEDVSALVRCYGVGTTSRQI